MPNGVKYVIMSIILVGLTKILQVTVFDSELFEENKKEKKVTKSYEKPKKYSSSSDNSSQKKKPVKITPKEKVGIADNVNKSKTKNAENLKNTEDTSDITLKSLKNNYLAPLLAQLPEKQLRGDVVIRYYRHKKDLNKIDKLAKMSYYIHEKEATETAGLGSNVIHYGDDVPLEDIQIIAFTLLEEGIPIKSIKHTKYSWKAKAVEIGTDTTLINKPNLSVREIRNFRK